MRIPYGGVAQLGERSVRNAEVEGSTPFTSTYFITFSTDVHVGESRRVNAAAELYSKDSRPEAVAGRFLLGGLGLTGGNLVRAARLFGVL